MTPEHIASLRSRAAAKFPENKRFFADLKRRKPKQLDATVAEIHEEVFAETDCLTCANCCKTTSPLFTDKDIERIAGYFGQRPAEFVAQHLHIDEDGDYVLNTAPCPFLEEDNTCFIYEVRPKACREYPHTDRKHFHQILNLTLNNTAICPAAFEVVERLKKTQL